jgi:hypothetical protein
MPRSNPKLDRKLAEVPRWRSRSPRDAATLKDSVYQIFSSQLFANQNHDARETFFATMTAQLLACLCLSNTSRQSADKYYAPQNATWRRRAWRSR